jgi:hypothetical protein
LSKCIVRRRPASCFHWIPVLLAGALGALPIQADAAETDSWWDGFAAPPAGKGMNSMVSALAVHDGKLVVGGLFTQAGNQTCGRHVARFNGTGWQALGCGTNGSVLALLSVGSDLYVGGAFTEASGVPAANVARWDGSWHAVGAGFGGHLCGLATYGGDVIAVGSSKPCRRAQGGERSLRINFHAARIQLACSANSSKKPTSPVSVSTAK